MSAAAGLTPAELLARYEEASRALSDVANRENRERDAMALEDASSRLLGERWADEQREAKLMAAADAESAGARDALAPGATALSSELALCVRGAHVRGALRAGRVLETQRTLLVIWLGLGL